MYRDFWILAGHASSAMSLLRYSFTGHPRPELQGLEQTYSCQRDRSRVNRLVLANLSRGQENCTDTTFISSEMRVVVHSTEPIKTPCTIHLTELFPVHVERDMI